MTEARATYIPQSRMTKVEVTQEYGVTDEDLIVLLDMAGYGINYWASTMTVSELERVVTVWDAENDGALNTVSFTDLAKALVAIGTGEYDSGYASYARNYLSDLLSEDSVEDAAGNIDADLADHVVQYAIWGELIYG